jgi:hypothetical protein
MKLYAYVFYIVRRAMVAIGNAKHETWFAFALVGGFEMYLLIDLVYVATVLWKLDLTGHEVLVALASIVVVGMPNYFLIYRSGAYKRYDAEFSRYSVSKHALCASVAVILGVGIAIGSAYLPGVLQRT